METCLEKNHMDDGLRTPLHLAAQNGHLEVVRFFMANLMDKNLVVNNGQRAPLFSAILGGHLNVCKLLIEEYKADVTLSNDYAMTPLNILPLNWDTWKFSSFFANMSSKKIL
jgi:ankyrin repeat protein